LPLVKVRWRRFRQALKADDQPATDELIAAFDDPLEAAIFAVLLEMARETRILEAPVLAGRHV
jgi:hypothetical protein